MKQLLKKILTGFLLSVITAFLIISLILLIKYFFVTLSGLYEPVFSWLKIAFTEEKIKNEFLFQAITVLKIISLIIAAVFIFIIYSAFSAVFSFIFYEFCSRNYKKIRHPLKFALIKGIKWNFYRSTKIIIPPTSVIITSLLLVFSSVMLFNILIKIAGISVSLTAFLISFISFSLLFLFIFSLLISLWQFVSTIFGTDIAISEPKLAYETIESRSKKLIFTKQLNIIPCIGYLVLIYNIIIQIKYALTTDLLTNSSNQELLNWLIAFNLFYLMVFEYLKASGYINSLLKHNKKIQKSSIKNL